MTESGETRAPVPNEARAAFQSAKSGDRALAFPRHLLPVEPDEDAEVVLEEVIPATDDGKTLSPRREARETALVLLYEAESRGADPREVAAAQLKSWATPGNSADPSSWSTQTHSSFGRRISNDSKWAIGISQNSMPAPP